MAVKKNVPADGVAVRAPEGMSGLAKGLAIIEVFGLERSQLTVSDAAALTDTTRAAARRCLLTLVDLGYLTHDGKHFRPTPRFLRLGAAYLDAAPLPQLAQPYLASAREALGESISLAVFEDGWSVFVARAETANVVTTGVRLGARLPAYGSATGQVLLAGLSDEEIRRHLTNPPPPTTAHMIVDPKVIMSRIDQARIEGFAFTDEELELGMRSMAVPVRNAQGKVVAAMSISTFTARLTLQELRDQCLPVLQKNAALLGCML